MKTFIVVFAFIVVAQALTEKQLEKLKNDGKVCREETDVDKALLQKIREGDFSSEDPKLKKFALCMLKRTELVDATGKFHKEIAVSKVPEADRTRVSAAIEKCIKDGDLVDDDVAWKYVKCYHKEKPDHAVF